MDFHSQHQLSQATQPPPKSRTHQYRKVMKPLLERKRRARINKCLDELKDLMVHAMQSEGESITKLEKADVLELTVQHMKKLKQQNALGLTPQATYAGRFKAGYTHCAQEVSKFVTTSSLVADTQVSTKLISHLGSCIQAMDVVSPSTVVPPSPLSPAASSVASLPLASAEPSTTPAPSLTSPAPLDDSAPLDLTKTRRGSNGSDSDSDIVTSSSDERRDSAESSDRPWRAW